MATVRERHGIPAVGDPAHELVALVGNEEECELAQQVTPATGQTSAEAVDETDHGVNGGAHGGCEIVNGAATRAGDGLRRARRNTCQGRAAMSWKRPPKRRVRVIRDRLRRLYGRPVADPHRHPIAELVRTVLSQNTSDTNRDLAYERLRSRFPAGRGFATRRATR